MAAICAPCRWTSPNGIHPCYTMAVAQGNLRDASFCSVFPLEVVRVLAAGLTLAVAHVHSCAYVHGDIHLRNILVKSPPSFDKLSVEELREKYGSPETVAITQSDGRPLPANIPSEAVLPMPLFKRGEAFTLLDARIMLSDFGEAFAPATKPRLGEDCHTPLAFRAPEAYFEPKEPLSFSSDIWSLGRAIWDILGMQAIISSDFASETSVVAQYVDVLGPMPQDWWQSWEKRSQYFDEKQVRLNTRQRIWSSMENAFEEGVQMWRKKRGMGEFDEQETAAILKLMRNLLAYRPEDRMSASEILQSEWMVKWALPEFERAKILWEEQ